MVKKVNTVLTKPSAAPAAATDAFVSGKTPIKRLTIDLPPELHQRFKMAALRGEKSMVDLVRTWIDGYLPGSAISQASNTETGKSCHYV